MIKKALRRVTRTEKALEASKEILNPELIFGIVGPIGVDVQAVVDSLGRSLTDVGYKSEVVHLTTLMKHKSIRVRLDFGTYFSRYMSLIDYANAFRKKAKDAAALAAIAILEIRKRRLDQSNDVNSPALGCAYIVRQFKRQEEIALMRKVYGRKFVLVSVYGSEMDRRKVLMDKIRGYESSPKTDVECEQQAIKLIDIDNNQVDDANGQRISEVFHLGDVFVDGISPEAAETTIKRFIRAFFGDNRSSPTKDEYGLYTAAAAALRSVDLSRQVGAAIFSVNGEVISLGCNEVPKAGGGTYWFDDPAPIFRDLELGKDANHERKNEIFFDLISRLSDSRFLSRSLDQLRDTQRKVDRLLSDRRVGDARLMDILEFGRMIHAEMLAITDAARLGRPIKDATLYCTTFPCHLCAKHIVAAGIKRVVFLEPYPKSDAKKLHGDSITFEKDDGDRILFQPFMGISPRRYRDIFEKKLRKRKGRAIEWYEVVPAPRIEDRSASYIENEEPAAWAALHAIRNASRRKRSTRPRPQ